jgi:hypothetical protein
VFPVTTGPEFIAARRTARVLAEVAAERTHQDEKWGVQRLQDNDGTDDGTMLIGRSYATWELILKNRCDTLRDEWRAGATPDPRNMTVAFLEEVFEALTQAVAGNRTELRAELVQVAAMACKWIEIIDWREAEAALAEAARMPECRRAAGHPGPVLREFKAISDVQLPEPTVDVAFEIDGSEVDGGRTGETWLALYSVPVGEVTAELDQGGAERYDQAPRYERADS